MGEDGQRVPVGPNPLEDGGFDGVVANGRAGHGVYQTIHNVHDDYKR